MRFVVAAKGTNADRQRDVDVGSRLIRNSIRAAHQTEHRQVHRLLLREEPREQPFPQAVASDLRFIGNRCSVGAETHADAPQERGTMLVDAKVLFSSPDDFHWSPGCPRSEERRVGKECRSRWSPY